MRIVLMGTGPFAAPSFQSLIEAPDHEVVALFTQPERRVVKKNRPVEPGPARRVALDAGLPIHDPPNVNDAESVALLERLAPDLLVVCDYGQILKPATLAAARRGGINLHGSLLPKYRGAAPVQWAILSGDEETGVTVIHMTPRLDAGPMLVQRRVPILPEDDAVTLEERLAREGVGAVHEAIEMLSAWDGHSAIGTPQDASLASRAPRFAKSDGAIDWTKPAESIRNHVRGLKPWPGSYTQWSPEGSEPVRLIIDRVSIEPGASRSAEPGEVVVAEGDRLLVMAGDGALVRIERLQPAGKRKMNVDEFLRGHRIQPGQKLI